MEIDIRDFIKFLLSKIGMLILLMILFIILGAIYIGFILTPKYHSTTTLILVNRENNANSVLLQNEVNLNKNLVQTYSEIIKSRSVLGKVIKELDLDTSISKLSENIVVSSVENTEIIKIQITDEDPEMAQKIAKTTADIFKKEVQKIYNLTNVSIVDKANQSEKPYNINPVRQIILFAGVGLGLGIMITFFIFYFDTSIKSSEEIEEKLGLAVIGNVTLVNNNTKKGNKK